MPNFVDDVAAAVDALGPQHVGIIWGIGLTNWKDAAERDQFLRDITAPSNGG
jgi:hypothetical protein